MCPPADTGFCCWCWEFAGLFFSLVFSLLVLMEVRGLAGSLGLPFSAWACELLHANLLAAERKQWCLTNKQKRLCHCWCLCNVSQLSSWFLVTARTNFTWSVFVSALPYDDVDGWCWPCPWSQCHVSSCYGLGLGGALVQGQSRPDPATICWR